MRLRLFAPVVAVLVVLGGPAAASESSTSLWVGHDRGAFATIALDGGDLRLWVGSARISTNEGWGDGLSGGYAEYETEQCDVDGTCTVERSFALLPAEAVRVAGDLSSAILEPTEIEVTTVTCASTGGDDGDGDDGWDGGWDDGGWDDDDGDGGWDDGGWDGDDGDGGWDDGGWDGDDGDGDWDDGGWDGGSDDGGWDGDDGDDAGWDDGGWDDGGWDDGGWDDDGDGGWEDGDDGDGGEGPCVRSTSTHLFAGSWESTAERERSHHRSNHRSEEGRVLTSYRSVSRSAEATITAFGRTASTSSASIARGGVLELSRWSGWED
jgi:hypothetical protein